MHTPHDFCPVATMTTVRDHFLYPTDAKHVAHDTEQMCIARTELFITSPCLFSHTARQCWVLCKAARSRYVAKSSKWHDTVRFVEITNALPYSTGFVALLPTIMETTRLTRVATQTTRHWCNGTFKVTPVYKKHCMWFLMQRLNSCLQRSKCKTNFNTALIVRARKGLVIDSDMFSPPFVKGNKLRSSYVALVCSHQHRVCEVLLEPTGVLSEPTDQKRHPCMFRLHHGDCLVFGGDALCHWRFRLRGDTGSRFMFFFQRGDPTFKTAYVKKHMQFL